MQSESVELLITFIVSQQATDFSLSVCVCVRAYVCSDMNNNAIHCFLIALTHIQWLFFTLY